MINFANVFMLQHNKNIEGTKFKIGDIVIVNSENENLKEYNSLVVKITGVGHNGDGIEYSTDLVPFLLWEEELKETDRE